MFPVQKEQSILQETQTRSRPVADTNVRFDLNSELCEVLVAFESTGSLAECAALLGRDASVISRQLQRLAQQAPVLEKQHGRWRLSALGRQVSLWTREVAAAQRQLLAHRAPLRIASTREFCARILAPGLADLLGEQGADSVSLLALEDGSERALLDGRADLGFDCGSPQDPALRFKAVTSESFSVVVAPAWRARHRLSQRQELLLLPHLQYSRAPASRLLQLTYELPTVLASFNDIASVREACAAGHGWAVLPTYAVRRELLAGALSEVPGWNVRPSRFGVWWLRWRSDLAPWIERAVDWLKGQQMDGGG